MTFVVIYHHHHLLLLFRQDFRLKLFPLRSFKRQYFVSYPFVVAVRSKE